MRPLEDGGRGCSDLCYHVGMEVRKRTTRAALADGVSVEAWAESRGVNPRTLRRVSSGLTLSRRAIQDICDALDTTPVALVRAALKGV